MGILEITGLIGLYTAGLLLLTYSVVRAQLNKAEKDAYEVQTRIRHAVRDSIDQWNTSEDSIKEEIFCIKTTLEALGSDVKNLKNTKKPCCKKKK